MRTGRLRELDLSGLSDDQVERVRLEIRKILGALPAAGQVWRPKAWAPSIDENEWEADLLDILICTPFEWGIDPMPGVTAVIMLGNETLSFISIGVLKANYIRIK